MKLSPKDRWRVAVHEAGHAVVLHHLGLGTADAASITPDADSAGHCSQRNQAWDKESAHRFLVMLAAGRAAENVFTGTRRFIDGTDNLTAWRLIERFKLGADALRQAHARATELCMGELFEHVGAFASILHDLVEMDRDLVSEMVGGVPWDLGSAGGAA